MFSIFAVIVLGALVGWYALKGRAWLKTKPWAQGFFAWIEPIEIFLYKKSTTILWARFKMLIGGLLSILTIMGEIDLTPIMPLVPEQYQFWLATFFKVLPVAVIAIGWVDQGLRNQTSLPIEIVSLPDKVAAENPKVAEAVAMASTTKVDAVAAVKEATGK